MAAGKTVDVVCMDPYLQGNVRLRLQATSTVEEVCAILHHVHVLQPDPASLRLIRAGRIISDRNQTLSAFIDAAAPPPHLLTLHMITGITKEARTKRLAELFPAGQPHAVLRSGTPYDSCVVRSHSPAGPAAGDEAASGPPTAQDATTAVKASAPPTAESSPASSGSQVPPAPEQATGPSKPATDASAPAAPEPAPSQEHARQSEQASSSSATSSSSSDSSSEEERPRGARRGRRSHRHGAYPGTPLAYPGAMLHSPPWSVMPSPYLSPHTPAWGASPRLPARPVPPLPVASLPPPALGEGGTPHHQLSASPPPAPTAAPASVASADATAPGSLDQRLHQLTQQIDELRAQLSTPTTPVVPGPMPGPPHGPQGLHSQMVHSPFPALYGAPQPMPFPLHPYALQPPFPRQHSQRRLSRRKSKRRHRKTQSHSASSSSSWSSSSSSDASSSQESDASPVDQCRAAPTPLGPVSGVAAPSRDEEAQQMQAQLGTHGSPPDDAAVAAPVLGREPEAEGGEASDTDWSDEDEEGEQPVGPPPPRTWLTWLTEVVQVGLIFRLVVMCVWLCQRADTHRMVSTISAAVLYYLWSVGAIAWLGAVVCPRGRAQAANGARGAAPDGAGEVQDPAPGGDAQAGGEVPPPQPSIWHRPGLVYDIGLPLAALVLSVWPDWRHPEPLPQPAPADEAAQDQADVQGREEAMPDAQPEEGEGPGLRHRGVAAEAE